ncbi:hypothetical protein Glove_564g46 [Diversispora epigaea]|uniref:Uncharacterized protein n=1 Tax=Diversispora epigaea TaxID=1348612 RepID=A0A397GEW6_9GLOM|nr:hypothetical protein Glove_564g46 [Diversispora epigaea]
MKEYPKLIFNEIEEIKNGKYCKPIQKDFKSVDAIVAPNMLFHITVGTSHPIKMNGLKKLISKLSGEKEQMIILSYQRFILLIILLLKINHIGLPIILNNMPWKLTFPNIQIGYSLEASGNVY